MRINKFNNLTKCDIAKLSDIDFTDENCCFNKDYCFEYENLVFENYSGPADFRVILAVDDYDYVEDHELIDKLMLYYNSL